MRNVLNLGFSFLTLFIAFASAQPLPAEASAALQEGTVAASQALATYEDHFLDKPLWQTAISKGLEARRLAPDHPAPYRFLAEVYGHVNWFNPAWQAWEAYQARGGVVDASVRIALVEVGDWLGYNAFSSSNYQEAITYYSAVTRYGSASEEARFRLALSYLNLDRPQEALPYLEALTEGQPNNQEYSNYLRQTRDQLNFGSGPTDAFYRGLELYYSGNVDQAWLAFSEATRANPNYRQAFIWAGRTALELRQPKDAIPFWQKAVSLDPSDEGASYFLDVAEKQARWGIEAFSNFEAGFNAYQRGDMGAAAEYFAAATRQNSNYAEAWAWLGRVAYEAANYRAAYDAYGRAQGLEPSVEAYRYFFQEAGRRSGLTPAPTTAQTIQPPTSQSAAAQPATSPPAVQAPVGTAEAATATPQSPSPVGPAPINQAPTPSSTTAPSTTAPNTTAPTATQPVATQPAPTQATVSPAPVAEPSPTPSPAPTPPATATPEPTPIPAEPAAATGGPAIQLLDTLLSRDTSTAKRNGAVAFFNPATESGNLASPTNYAGGTVHQRLELVAKPSNKIVQVQLCLVPTDIAVKPSCSNAANLRVSDTGSYEARQPLSSFSGYSNIDWTKGISGLIVILRDENGVPLDGDFQLEGGDLDLFYPLKANFSAVLVPAGGSFAGW